MRPEPEFGRLPDRRKAPPFRELSPMKKAVAVGIMAAVVVVGCSVLALVGRWAVWLWLFLWRAAG